MNFENFVLIILTSFFVNFIFNWNAGKKKKPYPAVSQTRTSDFLISEDDSTSAGTLHIFVGPMFSGKTSRLLAELSRYADSFQARRAMDGSELERGERPLLINHKKDTRNEKAVISSHSSQFSKVSPNIDVIKTEFLHQVDVSDYSVIGVDEAQFYEDLKETVIRWVESGKHVYCAGLDGSARQEPFGHLHELLCKSDSFVKYRSICNDCLVERQGQIATPESLIPAPFTCKIGGDKEKEVDVGGADKYIPTCRRHWLLRQK